MQVFFFIGYAILVHLSVLLKIPLLQALAITSLCTGIYLLGKANLPLRLSLLAISVISFLMAYYQLANYLLFIPPIVVPVTLLLGFGLSLLKGKEPLVTAIGEAAKGPLTPEMRKYTKSVTQLWTGIFFLMITINLSLTFSNNLPLWSWVTSVGNYLWVGIIFISEFIYRKVRFKDHDHPNFLEYLKIVATSNAHRKP